MAVMRRSCPSCHRALRISQDLPVRVKCPHCRTGFRVTGEPDTACTATSPAPAFARPTGAARSWKRVLLLAGGGLVLLFGVPLLIVLLLAQGPGQTGTPPNEGTSPVAKNGKDKEEDKGKKGGPESKADSAKDAAGAADKKAEKAQEKALEPLPGIPTPAVPPKLVVKVIETVTKNLIKPKPLRLAVTPAKYDHMGKLLDSLGKGYQYTTISEADLYSLNRLVDYDVVFVTCAPIPAKDRELFKALRQFVEQGGTLYASDLRFGALQGAFPDYLAKKIAEPGEEQKLTANVVEAGLREALGSDKIKLEFPSTAWKPACFDRAKATVYIEGWYETTKKRKAFAPLLVRFACGKGTVIFTSFHNSEQNSAVELKLLRYLVFTAVIAHVESRVRTTMISGDFSPTELRRVIASPDDENKKVSQIYKHKQAGPLRFALGFANQGARLRLTLVAPDGKSKIVKEGTATFTVEIANAPAGDWRYTVTALHVPFPNFPFTLTVGEQSKG